MPGIVLKLHKLFTIVDMDKIVPTRQNKSTTWPCDCKPSGTKRNISDTFNKNSASK